MGAGVLEHKLEEAQEHRKRPSVWLTARPPVRLSEGVPPHRLFVACDGAWRGYFTLLPEFVYDPDNARAPFGLLFDPGSWVEIPSVSVRRFRGFTYAVPPTQPATGQAAAPSRATAQRPSRRRRAVEPGNDCPT
jgi:hypothetical protein